MPTADVESDLLAYCQDLGRRARAAGRLLAAATGGQKNAWLLRADGGYDAPETEKAANVAAFPRKR